MQPGKPDLIEMFGRHLVALTLSFQSDSPDHAIAQPTLRAYSGTLIVIAGRLFYLTAGHILKEIDHALETGRHTIGKAFLADIFGLGRVTDASIPFDYPNAPKMYVDDEGLDFGLIGLRRAYRDLLKANRTMPIEEDAWRNLPASHYDAYFIFGLPVQLMASDYHPVPQLRLSPALIKVEKNDQPPPNMAHGRIARFYANLPPDLPITDIEGMSGGPIFGLRIDPPMRYWIVALQSSWLRDSRVIAAVPIKTIATIVEEWIRENDPHRSQE